MVEGTKTRKFNGVRPEDVAFGKTLGEGKYLPPLKANFVPLS